MNDSKYSILGAGVTGLALGYNKLAKIYEAKKFSGGLCASYYIDPEVKEIRHKPTKNKEEYRFEFGGGHWIFGKNPNSLLLIEKLAPTKEYFRNAAVYIPHISDILIPYPIQHNLEFLSAPLENNIRKEINNSRKYKISDNSISLKDHLLSEFGKTLCEIFFFPFHEEYTAGLYQSIIQQDKYKSPRLNNTPIDQKNKKIFKGYNISFKYPIKGLDELIREMEKRCNIKYGTKITKINIDSKTIEINNKIETKYHNLVSTLPLNKTMDLCGLKTVAKPDPYTSVLVLNIGAKRGIKCPKSHWLYITGSETGFHRIGFYSNVDISFLPKKHQNSNKYVSLYVEKAYIGGYTPTILERNKFINDCIREIQDFQFIEEVEIADLNWVEYAYTWSWTNSEWKTQAVRSLEANNIHQMGRFGKWHFQGMTQSIEDGLMFSEKFISPY
jgi:protoporphyrinogen oxidase